MPEHRDLAIRRRRADEGVQGAAREAVGAGGLSENRFPTCLCSGNVLDMTADSTTLDRSGGPRAWHRGRTTRSRRLQSPARWVLHFPSPHSSSRTWFGTHFSARTALGIRSATDRHHRSGRAFREAPCRLDPSRLPNGSRTNFGMTKFGGEARLPRTTSTSRKITPCSAENPRKSLKTKHGDFPLSPRFRVTTQGHRS